VRLRAEVYGVDELDADLALLQDRAQDLREVLDDVGQELLDLNRSTFASEGGGTWAELAPSTVRGRGGRTGPILIDDGELFDALTRRGAQGSVYDLTGDSVTVGTDLISGRYADSGTRRQPRRSLVRVTGADRDRLTGAVQKHLERGL
jgi:hypothetical protein